MSDPSTNSIIRTGRRRRLGTIIVQKANSIDSHNNNHPDSPNQNLQPSIRRLCSFNHPSLNSNSTNTTNISHSNSDQDHNLISRSSSIKQAYFRPSTSTLRILAQNASTNNSVVTRGSVPIIRNSNLMTSSQVFESQNSDPAGAGGDGTATIAAPSLSNLNSNCRLISDSSSSQNNNNSNNHNNNNNNRLILINQHNTSNSPTNETLRSKKFLTGFIVTSIIFLIVWISCAFLQIILPPSKTLKNNHLYDETQAQILQNNNNNGDPEIIFSDTLQGNNFTSYSNGRLDINCGNDFGLKNRFNSHIKKEKPEMIQKRAQSISVFSSPQFKNFIDTENVYLKNGGQKREREKAENQTKTENAENTNKNTQKIIYVPNKFVHIENHTDHFKLHLPNLYQSINPYEAIILTLVPNHKMPQTAIHSDMVFHISDENLKKIDATEKIKSKILNPNNMNFPIWEDQNNPLIFCGIGGSSNDDSDGDKDNNYIHYCNVNNVFHFDRLNETFYKFYALWDRDQKMKIRNLDPIEVSEMDSKRFENFEAKNSRRKRNAETIETTTKSSISETGNSTESSESMKPCMKCVCTLAVFVDAFYYQEFAQSDEQTTVNSIYAMLHSLNIFYSNQILRQDIQKLKTGQITHTQANTNFWRYTLGIESLQFTLKYLNVHKNFTSQENPQTNQVLYNSKKNYLTDHLQYNPDNGQEWKVSRKLDYFAKSHRSGPHAHTKYCLSHLFTYYDFLGGTIGLAFLGKPSPRYPNTGICAKQYDRILGEGSEFDNSTDYAAPVDASTNFQNTALTSWKNYGNPISTAEAHLVTAHEIGHNLGAEHDHSYRQNSISSLSQNNNNKNNGPTSMNPQNPKTEPTEFCVGDQTDGDWLMSSFAVGGYKPNNKRFSTCSADQIRIASTEKLEQCNIDANGKQLAENDLKMKSESDSMCGNYIMEKNEECDEGPHDSQNEEKCCMEGCRLKKGAVCSPNNHACCTSSCSVISLEEAKQSSPCNSTDVALHQCYEPIYCDGRSPSCPIPDKISDRTPKKRGELCQFTPGARNSGKCNGRGKQEPSENEPLVRV